MFKRIAILAAVFIAIGGALSGTAEADVRIRVDKRSQVMHVWVGGSLAHVWPVSTAKRGYVTPGGSYRPFRLEPNWYSRKYDMAPMPHSIFYSGGYAIHGTTHIRDLGRPASRGCVRLHPANARMLFSLVRAHGMRNTRITIR